MIKLPNPSLPFGDPHDIRITYKKDGDCGTMFSFVINCAKTALIRRLQGYFQEYLPFSLALGCMEIPLAPEEEYIILNSQSLVFCGRSESNSVKRQEEWILCKTRVKGIGIQMSPNGIISIYLATEGIFPTKGRNFNVNDTSNGGTNDFPFPNSIQQLSSFEKVCNYLKKIEIRSYTPNDALPSLSEIVLSSDETPRLLCQIIDDPLCSDFSFMVRRLGDCSKKPVMKKTSKGIPHSIPALMFAQERLTNRIFAISPVALLFAHKIMKDIVKHDAVKPSAIALSHVSLNNPVVSGVNWSEVVRNAKLEMYLELKCLVFRSKTNADIWAVAMLFAKSAQIIDSLLGRRPAELVVHDYARSDPIWQAIFDSSAVFQEPEDPHPEAVQLTNLQGIVTVSGFQEDTGYKILNGDQDLGLVRMYHLPNRTPIARIPTGEMNNVCPLLALNPFRGLITDRDMKQRITAIVQHLRNHAITLLKEHNSGTIPTTEAEVDLILQNTDRNLIHANRGELLWGIVPEDRLPDVIARQMGQIIGTTGVINYDLLWQFLNPGRQWVWVDDAVWWGAMATALEVTIIIHDADVAEGGLREIMRYGNGNEIHVFVRGGHYTTMVPLNGEEALARIQAIVGLNHEYMPMF
jgi:hypothetical protein